MRKFGRKKSNREQMLKNLVTSLILYESIKTTEAKAKEARSLTDKMINIAKPNSLNSKRRLLGYFPDKNAIKKIYEVYIERYKDITSGYTKIFKIGPRLGDGAKSVIIMMNGAKIDVEEKKLDTIKDTKVVKK